MPSYIKTILFGIGVFAVFSVITVILKLVTHHVATENEFLGFFTQSDLGLGLIVAFVVTLSYEKRKRLNNNSEK
jgi:hypothetical protein